LLSWLLLGSVVLDVLSASFWASALLAPFADFAPVAERQFALYIAQAVIFAALVPAFLIWAATVAQVTGTISRARAVAAFAVPGWNLLAAPRTMRSLAGANAPLAYSWWITWVASAILNNLSLKQLWLQWTPETRMRLGIAELFGDVLSIAAAVLLLRLINRAQTNL
jgi:hypothetical protein